MLQLSGDIPADLGQPIAGLDAGSILAREAKRLAAKNPDQPGDVRPRRREAQASGLI
jgi:hypothetical protein